MGNIVYTKELLESAVAQSFSYAGVLRVLGLKQAGGTQAHVAKKIREYQIDTTHFTHGAHNKGKISPARKTPDLVFVIRPEGSYKEKSHVLRRCMLQTGFTHECAKCGLGPEWEGSPLTLEIDHIDGNWLNNLRSNLRFLCPNCHAQEDTSNRPHKYRGQTP